MLGWIDKRTGFVTMAQEFLIEDVPGGASYWYVFGSATLFAMIVQITTGIFLTFFYAPSATTAWESTKAIYDNPFQHYMLSIHYWGASAMIALVFLHLLQVLIWGAYKAPRELQWIVGVILLLVTLALGLTGYLLPWDMNAYFASQVSLNITGGAPVLGPLMQNIAQGGGTMGTNTINRFFGLHVWLMPAALIGLVGAHLAIFRHNGGAGPVVEDPRTLKPGRFFPNQIFMDTVASFLIFVIILFLAAVLPPFLDAKADPNVFFVPYPAWYFLSLFGLLRLAPPQLELIATIGVPTIFLIVLMLIPWIDRSTTRSYGSRRPILWGTFVVVFAIIGLSIYSQVAIMANQAQAASTPTAAAPVTAAAAPGGGGSVVTTSNSGGAKVFAQNCASCHGATGSGQSGAIPPLANNTFVTGDPHKVIDVVLNGLHGNVSVNGQNYNGMMPAWKGSLSNSDIASVVTYIRGSLGNNKAGAVKESDVAARKK
ncbi:MAG: cytochrome b N-terminal domain-containing protein [Candidatus Eremiobacteraeota bacterium]|nr:cytochrome b N-terminal domain-containing protein [Candidatus Eremiobacteraeota bacterium]